MSRVAPYVSLLARLVLGAVIIVAGALKVTNLPGSAQAVRAYQILPYDAANLVGYLLPGLEIILGLLLVLGVFTRWAAATVSVLLLAFVGGIVSAWSRGLSIDCGCFGGGGTIAPEQTNYLGEILRDAGLLALGLWLVVRPRSLWSVDGWLAPDRAPGATTSTTSSTGTSGPTSTSDSTTDSSDKEIAR
ncbi:DoxX family membrane protein [Arsenicicoccus piscis]|uniref:Methylamine utilisation protein MauE domain-containing protein n=1 Tax=Arsenicicoccus piscis TaxID=673954 RepID=A0ABQ6HNN1_9MICO|nr:MauE/DoxX family redox-associated membrane protein [Arsenicicoccus piscis]MCH8626798.1 DoxX family membrane protein [Arsenicicoccus piscis]GMA19304.1 hypothetical protein GCM10025862_13250 [Arsenicicoccus piscis]